MRARDLAQETASALLANRGRTLLTVLGIVIGIGAVIAMTSLIGGIRNAMLGSLGLNAARVIEINSGYEMSESDVELLERSVPGYDFIALSTFGSGTATAEKGSIQANVIGGDDNYLTATGAKILRGRTWTEKEGSEGATVCMATPSVMRQLFGDADAEPTGKTITVNDIPYQVIGVVDNGDSMSQDGFGYLFMPLKTVQARLQSDGWYGLSYTGFASEGVDVDQLAERTKQQIAKMQNIPDDQVDDYVWVYTMKGAIDSLNQYMGMFSLILSAVAGISLVVGGIGIMNMMLTNVTERIHEIGLRRALGATRSDITAQFLTESIAISVVGGIIGVAIGYAGSWGLAIAASSAGVLGDSMGVSGQIVPAVSPEAVAIATGICVLVGLVFGYYPARRAARFEPADALRYQ